MLIERALISVSDKTLLDTLGRALTEMGVEILSTGGSARTLRDSGVPVTEVSDFTGFPEIMDGRVKTLQPKIHGGLLSVRGNQEHEQAMQEHGIAPIDLLVVNLYPFEQTVAAGADYDQCIENIDIGGPAMIRAAAKNHAAVTVIVDPDDYEELLSEMRENDGATTPAFRRRMAANAYSRTGSYDAAISNWFNGQLGIEYPKRLIQAAELKDTLRYGENPHQSAAVYTTIENRPGVSASEQLQGKELSYNNLNDTDAAFELVSEFDEPAVAIIKHANPCGVAQAPDLCGAYRKAYACDTESAFGGIVAVNRPMDADTAREVVKIFTEVVIAPEVLPDARAVFAEKKNVRVLETGGMADPSAYGVVTKTLAGGVLAQSRDAKIFDDLQVVTEKQPTPAQMEDLRFAFMVAKHVKSNAIVYVRDRMTVGIGAGQMSRVNSCRIAAFRAQQAAQAAGDAESWAIGSVVASDAFFPFADGLLEAIDAGATAVIQPGGSIRDEEVIAAANDAGVAMVFTGMRHFRH